MASAQVTSGDGFPDDAVAEVADFPEGLSDRAEDSWEPLLIIAEAAGGRWPERARAATQALSTEEDTTQSRGIDLLGDVRGLGLSMRRVNRPRS